MSFLFNHIWGKTLRDGSANIFGMRRHPNSTLYPIRAIETYVAISRELGIILSDGYLFQAHITPKQATPLFLDKLLLLSRHLEKRLLLPSLTPSEIFITARDQAFFKTLFFSGDRGRDLGQVKTSKIARFPDDNVFFI